jgi:hypothetical protein
MASADRNPATALPIQALQGTHPACYARPGETFSEAEENLICSLPRAVRAGERAKLITTQAAGRGWACDDSNTQADAGAISV